MIELAKLWAESPEVTPLYVHLPIPSVRGVGLVIGKSAVQRYYKEEADAALEPVLKLLGKAGFTAKPAMEVGPIAETIVSYAKRNKMDLICVGTRGMTATGNLVMGSVATKVLHLADTPVIVVR